MPSTRKSLFRGKANKSTDASVIPSTVRFQHDKKTGVVKPLTPNEKMLCALRRVLADMSEAEENGCRYFISGKIQVVRSPVDTPAKEGEAKSYNGKGRCLVRRCHPEGHTSSMVIEFDIAFRDTLDEMGLADVEYTEATTIDEIPPGTSLNVVARA